MYRPFITAINTELSKHQLYSSQWNILRLLTEQGPLTFADIAKAIYVEKPSASHLIHKLREVGYVETKQGKDKREKYVQLTAEGAIVFQNVEKTIDSLLESLVEGISQEDQEVASRVLAQILHNLVR